MSETIWKMLQLLIASAALSVSAAAAADDLDQLVASDPRKMGVKANGVYEIAGTTANLHLVAKQKRNRRAQGTFRHTLVFQGLLIDFVNKVTCLSVDPANGRAWIGGVVVENNSDHPAFMTEIHEPGKDVWFRVLDTGKDADEPDRTTFLGFEGAAGIITSAEYCAARIWPGPPDDEENARTNPLIEGKVEVAAD